MAVPVLYVQVTDDDASARYLHPDAHELFITRLMINCISVVMVVCFIQMITGKLYSSRFLGMSNTQFYHLGVADDNENMVVGGAQDNGIIVKNENTSFFENYREGDGFDIAMPHGTGNFILATINYNTYFFQKTFPSIVWYLNLQTGTWFKTVATSWFDSTKFAGGTQILRWSSFSESSAPVGTFDANGRWALTTSPSNGNRLYCAGGPAWNDDGDQSGKTLSRSDDKGNTWTALAK
jgi:hypothetical protein